MIAAQSPHPAKDQLIAFGQGKLADDESSRIGQHLELCRECCETLLDLKDDTFTGLVRHAKQIAVAGAPGTGGGRILSPPETDQATDGHVAGPASQAATLLTQSAETVSGCEVPAELRDHPRYRVVQLIGQGGMGAVYRAEHRLMNRAVAIKLINAPLVQHPQAVERFRREVQAAAKLSHPNIVAAYDAEQAGNAHFLVMEFVDGTDLATVIEQHGPMPIAEACECIRQAAAGLQHAHEKGMVHRDIKPHNLMLAAGGQVRILDFGLAGFATESALCGPDSFNSEPKPSACGGTPGAKAPSSDGATGQGIDAFGSPLNEANPRSTELAAAVHLTALGSLMGTPDYMAPEQAADAHSADVRADIYSLGCTLHFLLIGKPPFQADNAVAKIMAHAEQSPPNLTSIRADVPPELSAVVARMVAKNPDERFQTPAEVANVLASFARSAVAPPRKRLPRIALAAAAAILLAGVIYITTDRGRIEIRTHVHDVDVVVSHGGKAVKTIDLATGSHVTWMRSGDYTISLKQHRNDIQISPNGFTLSRLGKQIVSLTRLPETAANDYERIQGEWAAESGERNGQPLPIDQIGLQRAVFDGDMLRVNMPGGMKGEGHFQLTDTASPRQIGLFVAGENKGMRGIYKLEGDRLTLGMDQNPAGPLPSRFAAPAGSTIDVVVMRRVSGTRGVAGTVDKATTTFRDLAAVTAYLNDPRNNRGGSVPVALLGREGRAAFRFGTWLVVFEGIACDPKAAILGFSNFNIPLRGSSGEGTIDFGAGDKLPGVLTKFKFADEQNEISINNYRFKLRGKATRLEFDKAYDATNSLQTILVARDGSTRLQGPADEQRLQGKWVAVSGHARKQPIPAEQLKQMSITFDGEQVTFDQPGVPAGSQRGTFKINSNSNPNQITLVAPDPKKETLPGIYEFDGERLKLAFIDEDYARPTNFEPDDRPDHMTLVLERAPLSGPALGPIEREALKAAQEFLAVMDEGKFGQLFDMSASWAKRSTTREKTSQMHQTLRDSFGKAIHRTLHRALLLGRAPQQPEGRYACIQFKSRFERQEVIWETVLLNVEPDGKWRVNSYAWSLEEPALPEPQAGH
jgi:uncharacterized protein (TIGR03067 family)